MGFLPYFTVKYRCIANASCTLSLQLILVIIRQHAQKNIDGQSDSSVKLFWTFVIGFQHR